MPTGQAFAAFNLKQLLGWQDIGVRGMAALRANHVEATAARWDVDGVFNTKLTMSSPGANKVQVDGTSKATDGLGHVLTISAAYKKVADFQNSGGVTYHVGLMYAEVPSGLRINPRTGKPQFDRYTEEVGFAGIPTSVTDNGNGTITFNVNSVTEAGVSNASRLVRVYKVVPGDGCTAFAMALEECTVAFGTNNTITTVGKFGQTTVSTTAGDYIVVCMGPRVARNTDLSTVSGVAYIGTVLGNGATPVTFSNTNQTLLKTFTDASQVTYTPAGWLAPGATTVQLALDALVNGLQASTPSGALSGANRVGVYAPEYSAVTSGGIGNVADGNFSTSGTVRDLGLATDRAIKRRWSFFVKNDGNFSDADDSSGTSITNSLSSPAMWLRKLINATTTPYVWGSDTATTALGTYIMGEWQDITQASPHLRYVRTNIGSATQRSVSPGKWQRLWLDSAQGGYYRFGGSAQRSGGILENCGINGGALLVEACASTTNIDWGFNFRNGVVIPKDEATKAWGASARFGAVTSAFVWSVWENMLVYGPSATQTTPAGAGYTLLINSQITGPLTSSTSAAHSRPFVFRDCVFITQRATDVTVAFVNSDHPVVFENCRFFGISGHAAGSAFLAAAGANITCRDCVFHDPECMTIDCGATNGISGHFENCTFVNGGGTAGIANAQCGYFTGNNLGLHLLNCRFLISTENFRVNGGASTSPMVSLRCAAGGYLNVKGLLVKMFGVAGNTGQNPILDASPINGAGGRMILEDIDVDLSSNAPSTGMTVPLVSMNPSSNHTVDVRVRGVRLSGMGIPVGGDYAAALLSLGGLIADGITVWTPTSGAGTGRWDCHVRLFGGGIFSNIDLPDAASSRVVTAPIRMSGDFITLTGISPPLNPFQSSGTPTAHMLYCVGNGNRISGFKGSASVNLAPSIVIDGRDNELSDVFLDTTVGTVSAVPVQFLGATNRRNRCLDSTFHYNGTTFAAVSMAGPDCLIDSCIAYRSAGATAAFTNAGAGSVTGSTITSTTL